MMSTPRRLPSALVVALAALASLARAELKLPALFSDHMVLQRDAAVPVWGWASPGDTVEVAVGRDVRATRAGADGAWRVDFARLSAAGPTTLTVKSGEAQLEVQDVLIGEVWLGSGQSNMAMTMSRVKDFEHEQPAANFPLIRMFREESHTAATAQREGKGKWVLCSPETIATFSAVLYFFGRELHRELGAPIGLIDSSVGGTPIESWIAPEAQRAAPELKGFFEELARTAAAPAAAKKGKKQKAARSPADSVGGLFNGKIAPLIPYALRGALWYQGEANTLPAKAPFYEAQLKLLVTDWRARWSAEFPFAWAQLPNFSGPGRNWPLVREAMLHTLALPKTGMGINIDIGEENDIHPKNKQEVGRRLSLWALGRVYGKKVPATSGPLPAAHEVRGRELVLHFAHTSGGLVAHGDALEGFLIAGDDQQWKPAQARIEGDAVVVSSAEVAQPVTVRYAWENFPKCNLYNSAGLPATPFRTDAWDK